MIGDVVLDRGLLVLVQKSTRLVLTAEQAMIYADVVAIGAKVSPVVVGPSNAPTVGRMVTVNEITDGQVVVDGEAGFWALVDDNTHICMASGPLDVAKTLVHGNSFILAAFNIILPG